MSNPKAPAETAETPSIDARLVRKLADILKDTGLSEIEVEHVGLKIRVARELTVAPTAYVAAPAPLAPSIRRRSAGERPPRSAAQPSNRAARSSERRSLKSAIDVRRVHTRRRQGYPALDNDTSDWPLPSAWTRA